MPSFSTIASFAAVAFAAFTSAVPIQAAGVANLDIAKAGAAADVPAFNAVAPRHLESEVRPLPTILAGVINEVTPLVAELGTITKENCEFDVISPIAETIIEVLHSAAEEIKGLVDCPVSTIFGNVDGAVDLKALAHLLGSLLTLIFTAVGAILNILGDAIHTPGSAVYNVLCNLGMAVEELLKIVFIVVGGLAAALLAALLPLISKVVPVILALGLGSLSALLHLL
jgi:hypothetical protein